MDIRIGNDIKLNVTLLNTKNVESVNIKSLEAFIINTTKESELAENLAKKMKFFGRFPQEPNVDAYYSTSHDINSGGFPTWHTFPTNQVLGRYSHHPEDCKLCDKCEAKTNLTEYKAIVKATADANKVEVFFPAEAQLYTGTYKLVIVAKVYEEGYSINNLKTVTMDYENVFTLTKDSASGIDSDVTVQVVSKGGSKSANSISIGGQFYAVVNGRGTLVATVMPIDVVDPSVKWTVEEDSKDYVSIINQHNNICQYSIIGKPADKDTFTVKIKAESTINPDVTAIAEITATGDYRADNHVENGGYNPYSNSIDLNMADGSNVTIDVSPISEWYNE